MNTSKVFISYAHSSPEHKQAVANLAAVLRSRGLTVIIDTDVKTPQGPEEGWPKWMKRQLKEADWVLMFFDNTYRRRFDGEEVLDKGLGATWEGAIITHHHYRESTINKKFIPLLADGANADLIPDEFFGYTRYLIPQQAAELAEKLYPPFCSRGTRVFVAKLPSTGEYFLGREAEFELLDHAWASKGRTQVVELVAWGGVGKTALVKRWLDRMKAENWRGARRVYAWSFYSHGAKHSRQTSDGPFLEEALRWFGVVAEADDSASHKWCKLADEIVREPTLLVLDGIESLQHPPGLQAGELRTPGMRLLLQQLAANDRPGLCVVTTRERIQDLAEHEKSQEHQVGPVVRIDLGNLCDSDGAILLHRLGACHAGPADILKDDHELAEASREVLGHALALTLLGRYLAVAHRGDIRRRSEVKFSKADANVEGGHAKRVMEAYENWFKTSGNKGERLLAALRLLGFFDHPASEKCLAALRKKTIHRLNEPLVGLDNTQWRAILASLEECGLLSFSTDAEDEVLNFDTWLVDTHPLIRDYFHERLVATNPAGWRQGNARLYRHLKDTAEREPGTSQALQPLYRAIAHGCQAGLHDLAFTDIYSSRILRGREYYSVFKLGTFGEDLGALACFFEDPWSRPSTALDKQHHALLFAQVSFYLRAVGRLIEALPPSRTSLEASINRKAWTEAAVRANNLSELELVLGNVAEAIHHAEQAVAFADRSVDVFQPISTRTTLADALHQAGRRGEASEWLRQAETRQQSRQSHYPRLYSLQGFRYCSLLMSDVERAAWRIVLTDKRASAPPDPTLLECCRQVELRAAEALEWESRMRGAHLIDFGLHRLTSCRSALYGAILSPDHTEEAQAKARSFLDIALKDLRRAGAQEFIVRGLLSSAWLHSLCGNMTAGQNDLNEAWEIARRGPMQLLMADIHLYRARLFRTSKAYPWNKVQHGDTCGPQGGLASARALIERCGYWRRREELEEAEEVTKNLALVEGQS